MTFTLNILAREITAAIAACASVVDSHSQIPILRCTRIHVADGQASFTATNTDQTVVAKAACEGAGTICIDTAALSAKVQTLKPDATVSFAGDGKSVTITQGRTRWVAPVLLDADFPHFTDLDEEPVNVGKDFIAGLKQCIPAVDVGDTRYYLEGAHLDGDRVVATNGKQLRIVQHGTTIAHKVTIPAKAVNKIVAMFPEGAAVRTTQNTISFSTPSLMMKTKVAEGEYPAYRRITEGAATDHHSVISVRPDAFSEALARAIAIKASGEKAGSFINIQLRFREGEIEFFTRNTDGEEGSDFALCERLAGEDADIAFNGAYLASSIQSLDCANVEISYGPHSSPIIMRAAGSERENVRLIMPRKFA